MMAHSFWQSLCFGRMPEQKVTGHVRSTRRGGRQDEKRQDVSLRIEVGITLVAVEAAGAPALRQYCQNITGQLSNTGGVTFAASHSGRSRQPFCVSSAGPS